jgi:DNA-binding NarL/FixJ family response regulator
MPFHRPRLLLADDHQDVLVQITTLLSGDFEIVGRVNDGLALLEAAARLTPDAIVTDYKMPGLDGIQAARKLRENHLCKAVVLITLHEEQQLLTDALEAGIKACVLKRNAVEDLSAAVHAVLEGRTFFQNYRPRLASPSSCGGVSSCCCGDQG